jgi:hypothetical protein
MLQKGESLYLRDIYNPEIKLSTVQKYNRKTTLEILDSLKKSDRKLFYNLFGKYIQHIKYMFGPEELHEEVDSTYIKTMYEEILIHNPELIGNGIQKLLMNYILSNYNDKQIIKIIKFGEKFSSDKSLEEKRIYFENFLKFCDKADNFYKGLGHFISKSSVKAYNLIYSPTPKLTDYELERKKMYETYSNTGGKIK